MLSHEAIRLVSDTGLRDPHRSGIDRICYV